MPRGRPVSQDPATLQMALVGYEIERQRIEQKIKEIQGQLGVRRGPSPGGSAAAKKEGAPKKRTLSAAARKRIAAAQRRRWAEHRKKMAQSAKSE